MDTQEIAGMVYHKLKGANVYSELNDSALYKSIHAYIKRVYEKHLYDAQKKLRAEEVEGVIPSTKKYEAAYAKIEEAVLLEANKLAAIEKSDL